MAGVPSLNARLGAEFLGTFLLTFTAGCNILGLQYTWGPVSIACVLMVSIYSLGGISGANFNPAVSVALGLVKSLGGPGLDWRTVGLYSGVQILGGIAAALFYSMLFGQTFNLAPNDGFAWLNAGIVELIYTFMLCFVVLNVAAARKNAQEKNQYFGLAIGFVIIAAGYGAGAVSGACLNPAVSIGIDVASIGMGFGWCVAYAFFELLGAALSAWLFLVVRPSDFGYFSDEARAFKAALVSEFLGTFILVFTVGLNVLGKSLAGAFSIAAALMSMIYALGDVSGAHFNPAVTLAVFFSRRVPELTLTQALMYVGVQLVAGICASFSYVLVYVGGNFPIGPVGKSTWLQVTFAELIFTFLLCYIVLSVAVSNRTKSSHMFGLAIGSCVTIGGCAIGSISGGSLNPAVSVGIASTQIMKGGFLLPATAYTAVELLGGLAAVGIFRVTHDADLSSDVKFGERF
eukprot:CAMPEP_0197629116 /NCGR_PEP_ID=MMETSP1338-20131121/7111_1 /TAXON_ID=43686 ORGANISM="Pelagodinium beii, Strain RCC1491" /NCGR_SAMPLE_ID=MMETSP1338 /ASSEMBLY_ACC=CAM_ASM_000754 /LENGTH=459 /DNA_ID=CAMNT_0043200131 /DNA_START=52 /DNA_END=1431 /DNA_ORIENTATION=+